MAKLRQPQNAAGSILVTLLGMVMLARAVQLLKAELPILVTAVPRVAVAKLRQPSNALGPILVTLLGMLMLVRLMRLKNA